MSYSLSRVNSRVYQWKVQKLGKNRWILLYNISQSPAIYHLIHFWGRYAKFILKTCIAFFFHYIVWNLPKSMEYFNRQSILKFHSLIIHCEEISSFNWQFVQFNFNCLQELRGIQQRNFSYLLSPFHLWF